MSHLYVHFPFCLYKCHYCDFNSHARAAGEIPFDDYRLCLEKELVDRLRWLEERDSEGFGSGAELKTIFFGGGTPSLVPPGFVSRFLETVSRHFVITPQTEITLEANPKTIDAQKLRGFREEGITRLSLGIQSLHDAYLSSYGRIHSADDAREAIRSVATCGFRSWSADLMFGFPGETLQEWKKDVSELAAFHPPHLSCYAFTVEKETIVASKVAQGLLSPPDNDVQADLFRFTQEFLEGKGYQRYEVSNFSKPGFESRHNLAAWNYRPYLGLGAGAVSFFFDEDQKQASQSFGSRTTNFKKPGEYMKAVTDSANWFDEEMISVDQARFEYLMMGWRLKHGIDEARFERLFGKSVGEFYPEALRVCREKGWIENTRLTSDGTRFLNQVLEEFL